MKSEQTVEPFQASKFQPDIIITFSQRVKDLAKLKDGVGWGGLGKEASLPGAHEDTWREAKLTSVKSEYVMINPSADGRSTVQHINYRRDGISKRAC
jgi:hypothetical protein